MAIQLPEHLERKLQALVGAGRFSSVDVALRVAVEAFLANEEPANVMSSKEMHQGMQQGLDEYDRGEWIEGNTARELMREHSRKMREKYGERLPRQSASAGGYPRDLEPHRVG